MIKKSILIGLYSLSILAFCHPVYAGDKKLEEEVAELRRILDAQSKNLATATAQVQEMASEFQKISGLVDQAGHGTEQQSKVITDNQRRLDVLEEKVAQLLTQLEDIKSAGLMTTSSAKDLGEFKTFQTALTKLNGSDYKSAATSLQEFLKVTPKSRFADAAQYWVGESYYSMRDFPKAISEYQKVIKDYPKSSKQAPSLFKQGICFFQMQSFEDAKTFLEKVITKYPTAAEATLAKLKLDEIAQIQEEKNIQNLEKKATM